MGAAVGMLGGGTLAFLGLYRLLATEEAWSQALGAVFVLAGAVAFILAAKSANRGN